MADELRGLFPRSWSFRQIPIWEEACVIYNWLNLEIDEHAIEKMPMLEFVVGWRNHEVYEFIRSHDSELVETVYGQILPLTNVHWDGHQPHYQ